MFKLLNDEARNKVQSEYKLRKGIVALSCLCAVLFLGIVSLLPSYFYSNSRSLDAKLQTEALRNSSTAKEGQELVKELASINQKINFLSPEKGKDKPYEFYLKIINTKPSGIAIGSLSWRKDFKNSKDIKILISGVAKDRKTLISFRDQLNATGSFTEAVLPVSNFAKDKDIEFEINVSPII